MAATLYSVWRAQLIVNTIDAALAKIERGELGIEPIGLPRPDSQDSLNALRSVLDNFEARGGRGASGVNFFDVPGVADASDRRDIVLLKSLQETLELLASDTFKAAFANSTRQSDYRWGKLHRIVFAHPLGGPFSVPPAGGAFPAPLPGLTGIPTDGGFETVDAASHDARALSLDGYMFSSGPAHRFVAEMGRAFTRVESIWAGGTSGQLGHSDYTLFLRQWLANEAVPLPLGDVQPRFGAREVQTLVPAR